MKYYVYISDAKVDMLFPQVPHEIKKKVAVEYKMDVKILSTSRKAETESEDNRIVQLETVVNFIREYGNLGTVDEPDEYFEDTLPMHWGTYGYSSPSPIVYFGGTTERTIFGLGGSARHVIGNINSSAACSASHTPVLMDFLTKELGLPEERRVEPYHRAAEPYEALKAVEFASWRGGAPLQRLEFLAKRLQYWPGGIWPGERPFPGGSRQGIPILLGTPLYVALAD